MNSLYFANSSGVASTPPSLSVCTVSRFLLKIPQYSFSKSNNWRKNLYKRDKQCFYKISRFCSNCKELLPHFHRRTFALNYFALQSWFSFNFRHAEIHAQIAFFGCLILIFVIQNFIVIRSIGCQVSAVMLGFCNLTYLS